MSQSPNILFIFTDQHRADTLSCLGGIPGLTPNLDRLAGIGALFERAYCTQPVCTPSRASVLTGKWPHQHGCIENNERLPKDHATIAEMAPQTYRTGYFGKWHLGDELIPQRGFTDWLSIEDAIYRPYFSKPEYLDLRSDYHHYLVANGLKPDQQAKDGAMCFKRTTAANLPEPMTKAHFTARSVAERCRTHDKSQPFFWMTSIFEPHSPFTGPHNDLLDPESLPVGEAFARLPADNHSLRARTHADRIATVDRGMDNSSPEGLRRLRARYLGLVKLVDNAIGLILDALEENGLMENTIIVYASDHGEMVGDHFTLHKSLLYEEAARVPLIIRVPGEEPRRITQPVSLIDLAPTLLDAMGAGKQASQLPGESLLPLVRGQERPPEDVVVEWNSRPDGIYVQKAQNADEAKVGSQIWRSIITPEGWKLNLCATDTTELFDLNTDPCELHNRAQDSDCRHILEDLTRRLHTWQQKNGDSLSPH